MKSIGLTLSLLLFLNPLAIFAVEKPVTKQKSLYKTMVGDASQVISALAKTGVGVALIIAGGFIITQGTHAIIDRGIESWDTSIKLIEKTSKGITRTDEFQFNALPLITAFWGVIAGASIVTGSFAINSAINDLAAIKEDATN